MEVAAAERGGSLRVVPLFPLAEYWWFYLGFTALILVLLAVDLGVFHRKSHTISIREAARWSVVWISLSLLFNVAFYVYAQYRAGRRPAADARTRISIRRRRPARWPSSSSPATSSNTRCRSTTCSCSW